MISVSYCARNGSSFLIIESTPLFCRPIAFNIPIGVSAILGVGFPKRSCGVADLMAIPPNTLKSYSSAYSLPNPKHPLAGIIGFFKFNPGSFTEISIIKPPFPFQIQDHPYIHAMNVLLHLLQHIPYKHLDHMPYELLMKYSLHYIVH